MKNFFEFGRRLLAISKENQVAIEEYHLEINDHAFNVVTEETKDFSGTVTLLSTDYGLVNNEFYFEKNSVCHNVELGSNVCGTVVRSAPNNAWKVKLMRMIEHDRSNNRCELLIDNNFNYKKRLIVIKTGRICLDKNNGWSLCGMDVYFSDDKVNFNYALEEDDWVQCQINEKNEVIEVTPLRVMYVKGCITAWEINFGVINNEIYIHKKIIKNSYIPRKKDIIDVTAIESVRKPYIWRAVNVNLHTTVSDMNELKTSKAFLKELLSDKEGIIISGNFKPTVEEINIGSDLFVTIKNTSHIPHKLEHLQFYYDGQKSQFKILNLHDKNNLVFNEYPIEILSNQSIICHIQFVAKYWGYCEEICVFTFRGFRIGKKFLLNVCKKSPAEAVPNFKTNKFTSDAIVQSKWILPGQKKFRTLSYIPSYLKTYAIPNMYYELHEEKQIIKELPILLKALDEDSYAEKLHALLYLEELEQLRLMHSFNINKAFLQKQGDYLLLEVTGLAEQRPSLSIGDSVILRNPHQSEGIAYEGCVHQVLKTSVLLKFHPSFHSRYEGEYYQVSFYFSRTPYRRQHSAIDFSMNQLTPSVLFPNQLNLNYPNTLFFDTHVCTDIKNFLPKYSEKNIQRSINFKNLLHEYNRKFPKFSNTSLPLFGKKRKKIQFINKIFPLYTLSDGICGSTTLKILKWFNSSLNLQQRTAVKQIINGTGRPLPYLIIGPPGTGKTVTLVEVILQTFSLYDSTRILVATPSNSSADLIVEHLIKYNLPDGSMIRLMAFNRHQDSIPAIVLPYCADASNLNEICQKRIIVTTCSAAGAFYVLSLHQSHFTHVFIDEAGQVTEPETLVPLCLLCADKGQIILAGDPLQLGPVLLSKTASMFGLSISLLERLSNNPLYSMGQYQFKNINTSLVTQLVINYRAHPGIVNLYSQIFYEGTLISHVSNKEKLLDQSYNFLPNQKVPLLFHGIRGENLQEGDSPSWFNPAEVFQVIHYLKTLSELGIPYDNIGIVTPYRKQAEKIKKMMSILELHPVKIGCVEEFQGQEKQIIIISTVRSSNSDVHFDIHHSLGFVCNPKRLNVAISRAKSLLIIIGNPHLLTMDTYWGKLLLKIIKLNAYTGCDLPYKLSSSLTKL